MICRSVHLRTRLSEGNWVPLDGKGWMIGSGTVTEMPMIDHYFSFLRMSSYVD